MMISTSLEITKSTSLEIMEFKHLFLKRKVKF